MTIRIYAASSDSTTRDVCALIRNSGAEPVVVDWRQAPPERRVVAELIRRMDLPVHDLLDGRAADYERLGLDDPTWTDGQLLDLILYDPSLIYGPIVDTPLGVRLCRPAEVVLSLLPEPQVGAFRKEDGSPVIDAKGRRVDGEAPG
ncbi:arsenate reductase [Roseomonas sp. NAR14]|uniref:Arsenate reductase n=1 Tax=Roseomonas acroporae TaxID=2937791 RepID=A0A9X1Y4L2_9PROT|nr:ArsC/Spx/MgsR family protein [Roseomonas acroporae]MCK8783158.1 arsenate reductase [Roseomonas acroporae]